MPVTMTGSPNAKAYPGPSAEVWARRAQEEMKQAKHTQKKNSELREQVLTKAQKEEKRRKEKKAAEDAKFKARQQAIVDKQRAERDNRQKARADALTKIQSEHEAWQQAEQEREKRLVAQGRARTADMVDGVHSEDEIEHMTMLAQKAMLDESKAALAEQRRQDEANEMARQQQLKADRERKAIELRKKAAEKADADAAAERELAYRVKKEMSISTKEAKRQEEERQAAARSRGLEERKKNDEYDKWLSTDHIRTIAEQAHERKDPSKMHEGGRFSGKPTDFTPGR